MNKVLFKQIDNIGLLLFRIVFGFLITLEGFGAIATGWVRKVLVEPKITFNFIGFEFLQYLQGPVAYILFVFLGIFGIGVMLGYKYRWSMFGYAIIWTCVYLMQKTSYNNHYYLLMLLCWIMVLMPANRGLSIDAKQNPEIKSSSMPQWVKLVFVLQVGIVYTYGAVAKLYPGWWNGSAISVFMSGKSDYWLIGSLLQKHSVHIFMAYFGFYFDLLIVPLLLWKRTRFFAFILSIIFHLSNSIIFQIGIFPYMSIAFALFFFSPETLRERFLPKTKTYSLNQIGSAGNRKFILIAFGIYFLFQLGLPLRHWFFKDDVFWTEEGHRLSWRMMLRARSAYMTVYIEDKNTGKREMYPYHSLLSGKQINGVSGNPDMIWQFAQEIKKIEAKKGRDVAVYVKSFVSLNRGPYYPLTDGTIDLTSIRWNHFKHSEWLLPSPKDLHEDHRKL